MDVIVVGTGIVGLTSAVRLQQSGARVALWYAEPPSRTVSAVAAAVWYPTRTAAQPSVLQWGARTFAEYARQAEAGVPGVLMRETRMLLREPPDGEPWWGSAVPDLRPLTPSEYPDPYVAGWWCTVPLVEMPVYLSWLTDQFTAAGGVLVPRRIGTLDEATRAARLVVNATGLAARELCADDTVTPARGQILVTTNPGLRVSVRDEQHPDGYTYVHPRSSDVVLGGTFEDGEWDAATDPATLDGIWRRCLALVPELAGAERIRAVAGLRPTRRDGVRLAAEPVDGARIIHNYGHGGAGMTLAWGCADRVVELAG